MIRLIVALSLVANLAGCSSDRERAPDAGEAGAKSDGSAGDVGGNQGVASAGAAGTAGKALGANKCAITAVDAQGNGETTRGAEGTYDEASALYISPASGSRVLCKTQVATMLWYFRGDISTQVPLTVSEPGGNFTSASVSYRGDLNKTWACSMSAPPATDVGSITFTIDSAKPQPGVPGNAVGGGAAYLIHGTAHAECPPGGVSPGEGTVMLDLTF